MKQAFLTLCIGLFMITGCKKDRVAAVNLPEGFIENDWDATLAAAQSNDRLIYIHFYEPSCKRCAEFKEKTLNDPEVEGYIKSNYIGASLDNSQGKGKELESEYGISAHPASAVVDKDGNLKATKLGNMDKNTFLSWLKDQI